MAWLTEFQASLRAPVFGFLSASWQYLALGGIGVGWVLLYGNARRDRAGSGDSGGDSGTLLDADGDGVGGDGGGD